MDGQILSQHKVSHNHVRERSFGLKLRHIWRILPKRVLHMRKGNKKVSLISEN